jgi:preprotein translocase subunit SecA
MRLFGSERIASLMDRMGLQEGEVIQHSMISKSIERAQKKVEENHFGTRKRLIEYDDVMNAQRDVVYKRRRNALNGDRISIDIANMIYEVSESIVSEFHTVKDYEGFTFECIKNFGIESPFTEFEFKSGKEDDLIQKLFEVSEQHYRVKSSEIAEMAFPVVRDVYTNPNNNFENIVTPFTDGVRGIQVMANLKKSFDTKGRELVSVFEKTVILAMIDDSWKEHLREMDDLKQSVQNASLEQKDPLVVYKLESFNLFREMIAKTSKDIISFLFLGGLPAEKNKSPQLQKAQFTQKQVKQKSKEKLVESRSEDEAQEQQEIQKPKQQPIRVEQKIGRNDPCPCGSGKKYKSCHGIGVA